MVTLQHRSFIPSVLLASLFCLVLVALSVPLQASEPPRDERTQQENSSRYALSARLGLEYDDNPLRQEGYTGRGDGLNRYLLGLDILTDLEGPGQVLLSLRHGGELYFLEPDARAFLTEVRASLLFGLPFRLRLQLRGDLKDRIESASIRDYTRGGTELRLSRRFGLLHLQTGAGLRYFSFKPTPASSNQGPRAQASASLETFPDLYIEAGATRVWRNYKSRAWIVEGDRFIPNQEGDLRSDRFDVLHATLRYEGDFTTSLGYLYARNRSNSYGQELTRHGLVATATAPLFWDLLLSGRGEVQRTRYEDPVVIDEIFFLDEENRNSFAIALARPLFGDFELEARYSLFLQEFGIDGRYQRQLFGLSLVYVP